MLTSLLIYRLIIFNLVGIVLTGFAYSRGWVTIVLEGDSTRLVYAMIGLFLVFMVSLFIRAGRVSSRLNRLKKKQPVGTISAAKFLEKTAHLDDIPNWLVTLGLLGTVIGIMISLSGIDQGALDTTEGVKAAIATLMSGMSVAFCTTIAGGILALWCDINRRILRTATTLMLEDGKAAGTVV